MGFAIKPGSKDKRHQSWFLFRWLGSEYLDWSVNEKKGYFYVIFVNFLKIWFLPIVAFLNALLCQIHNLYTLTARTICLKKAYMWKLHGYTHRIVYRSVFIKWQ